MNTENNQPEWVAEVLKTISRVQKRAEDAVESFNATVAKSGLLYAIEWRSSDVAETEGLSLEVSWLAGLFTSEKHLAELESTALMALEEIERRKSQLLNCLRVGASTSAFANAIENASCACALCDCANWSTSAFANAIENAKLEARARAFDSFGGVYSNVAYIIENRSK